MLAAFVLLGAGLRAAEAAAPRLADESADERFYGTLARTLAEHLNYGDRTSGPRRPFNAAPGAPVAFAVAHLLTPSPDDEPSDIPAAYWLLAAVGTLLIVATFGLARELGGDLPGLVAAAVVAVYPPFVRTTGELLSEPLGALTLTLAVLALLIGVRAAPRGLTTGGGTPRGLTTGGGTRRGPLVLGGALLGVTALVRPDLLVALVACPLALLAIAAKGRRLQTAATVLAASLLTIAPWVAFASARSGHLVPIVENDAPTLLIGTYLPGDGTTQGFKRAFGDETRARVPRLRGVPDLELPGVEVIDTVRARRPDLSHRDALRAQAFGNVRRYALGRPAAFAAMMARKTGRMWLRPSQVRAPALTLLHRIGLALALAGLVAGLVWLRDRRLILPASVVAASTVLHAVLVAHPRYAMPLIPMLVAGGASALRHRQPTGPAIAR